jgi:hypothetical protein
MAAPAISTVQLQAMAVQAIDASVSSANATATVTYPAAGAGKAHVISGVAWSYSAAPTGGGVTLADGTNTVFTLDVTASGPGYIDFVPPKQGTPNVAMVATILPGSGSVVGKLNVLGHTVITAPGGILYGMDFSDSSNSALLAAV